MSKSLMILNTPKSCEECDACVAVLGKHYCASKRIYISKGERDCSCQLVVVPMSQGRTSAPSDFFSIDVRKVRALPR